MPRALYRALGKAFAEGQDGPRQRKEAVSAGAVGGFFVEGRPLAKKCFFLNLFAEGRPSANKFFYFFLKNLCRGPPPWPSAKKFSGFFKNSLPRAGPRQRNGFFEIFFTLCRGPPPWPSAKKFSGFFKISLPRVGPRQRNGFFEKKFNPLPRACSGPRQRNCQDFFPKNLCRGLLLGPSAKDPSLPRALVIALGKEAEI